MVDGDAGLELKGGLRDVPLGKKQVQAIGLADGQAQAIEVDRARLRRVDAPEVQHQALIDEDPEIVVAGELQHLAATIGKSSVELKREVVVMRASLVAEQLPVDGEKRRGLEREDARARRRLPQLQGE